MYLFSLNWHYYRSQCSKKVVFCYFMFWRMLLFILNFLYISSNCEACSIFRININVKAYFAVLTCFHNLNNDAVLFCW